MVGHRSGATGSTHGGTAEARSHNRALSRPGEPFFWHPGRLFHLSYPLLSCGPGSASVRPFETLPGPVSGSGIALETGKGIYQCQGKNLCNKPNNNKNNNEGRVTKGTIIREVREVAVRLPSMTFPVGRRERWYPHIIIRGGKGDCGQTAADDVPCGTSRAVVSAYNNKGGKGGN